MESIWPARMPVMEVDLAAAEHQAPGGPSSAPSTMQSPLPVGSLPVGSLPFEELPFEPLPSAYPFDLPHRTNGVAR
jgi:hypothetical protein